MTQCIPYPLNEFIIEGRHVAFGSQAKNYEHWVGQLKAEFSSGWRNKLELNKQLREVMNHVPQGGLQQLGELQHLLQTQKPCFLSCAWPFPPVNALHKVGS